MNKEESATDIRWKRLDKLIEAKIFLNCLLAAGVEDWKGYKVALDLFERGKRELKCWTL